MAKEKEKSKPWYPPAWEKHHAMAIKCLAEGNANEHQQKIAFNWILYDLCGTYDLSYRPDSQRDSDFAEGKRFVGLQLVKLLKIKLDALTKESDNGRANTKSRQRNKRAG